MYNLTELPSWETSKIESLQSLAKWRLTSVENSDTFQEDSGYGHLSDASRSYHMSALLALCLVV